MDSFMLLYQELKTYTDCTSSCRIRISPRTKQGMQSTKKSLQTSDCHSSGHISAAYNCTYFCLFADAISSIYLFDHSVNQHSLTSICYIQLNLFCLCPLSQMILFLSCIFPTRFSPYHIISFTYISRATHGRSGQYFKYLHIYKQYNKQNFYYPLIIDHNGQWYPTSPNQVQVIGSLCGMCECSVFTRADIYVCLFNCQL